MTSIHAVDRLPDGRTLELYSIPGFADTEIHAVHHAQGPLLREDVQALIDWMRRQHGAMLLRATIFGDIVGPPPDDDRWIWVQPTARHCASGTSVELFVVAPHADTDASVRRLSSGATLVTHSTPDGGHVRRLVHCIPRPAGTGTYDQVANSLTAVETALAESGMTPLDIDRTWFFMADIGNHYDALNAARDDAFDRWQIRRYPASTGIGAALPPGIAVSMVVESTAVDAVGDNVEKDLAVLSTPLQTAPSDYGPRFIRGNLLRVSGRRTVNVSGISSIDPHGQSISSADPTICIDYAMRSMLGVLRSGGADVADISSSYVYCKDAEVSAAFSAYRTERGMTFPYLLTCVPVCRPELVFEIEARAVRQESVLDERSAESVCLGSPR